jgi:hypothetical protein
MLTEYAEGRFPVDSFEFFEELADAMNAAPERYEPLGWCDLDLGVVVHRRDQPDFRALLCFGDYACALVTEFPEGDEAVADCYLEGDVGAWAEMVDNIRANGRATGRHTLSSLVLLGEEIEVRGVDPMGVDRFFRYAQSLQQFFDGAATGVPAVA